jgi:CRISP-associated protein Cas1
LFSCCFVADLYKTEISIPVAFQITARAPAQMEREVRLRCRDLFRETKLLSHIVPDVQRLFEELAETPGANVDFEPAWPGELWSPEGNVSGGVCYGTSGDGGEDDEDSTASEGSSSEEFSSEEFS